MEMKKYYKLVLAAIIVLMVAPCLTSCSDEDESGNEWTDTVVYLQRTDYLIPDKIFKLQHTGAGILGEVNMTFRVKTQRPAEQDITVDLIMRGGEGLDVSKLLLTTPQIVIKAGSTQSEDLLISISDFSFLQGSEDPESYSFSVSIGGIKTTAGNTRVSNDMQTLSAMIEKSAFLNLTLGVPVNSKLITNRQSWILDAEEGVENGVGNLVDGSSGSDVARSGLGFWVTINLGEVKTITGIKTNHWGDAYAPSKVEVFYSTDGTTWKSLGIIDTKGREQNLTFLSRPQTQYLKYDIIGMSSSGRVDVTELNIYETNAK